MADILHKITIQATATEILRAITEQEGLAGWWTRDVSAKPQIGSVAEFGFENHGLVTRMKIVQISPARVEWQCIDGPREWIGTTVTFDLEPQGEHTTLRFAQRGWKEASDFYAHCNTKWGYFLGSLKSLLEQGKGTPEPDATRVKDAQ